MDQSEQSIVVETKKKRRFPWLELVLDLALILVLLVGAFFRFKGLFWGEYSYLHPDERFLVWVTADISAVPDLGTFFNTAISTLNPHNQGHTFYVYGTLPIFLTRYLADALFEAPGWEQILQVGRALSASADLLSVLLVYLIGSRLFNRRVGLVGAAFSAAAVLQIQQAHFFTVDSFAVLFTTLAVYLALRISTAAVYETEPEKLRSGFWQIMRTEKGSLGTAALFGLVVGLAMASKVNTAVVALALPAALLIRRFSLPREQRANYDYIIVRDLAIGGVVALLAFRIAQPYAFSGPGFFNITPNPLWVQNLKDLKAQTSGDVDFPPALQWARRSVTFSFENLSLWGVGIPFAVAAWAGFLWMGWKLLKGDWKPTILLWAWTAGYFVWQSVQANPTMRYQMPIYPTLAVIAGWGVVHLWDSGREKQGRSRAWRQWTAIVGGGIAIVLTAAWAFSFVSIYGRTMTRVEASRWIYANVPGPISLQVEADGKRE
jgi:4-amino-4-deoxy-L-arabinose transferase-like glycosyltransferase